MCSADRQRQRRQEPLLADDALREFTIGEKIHFAPPIMTAAWTGL